VFKPTNRLFCFGLGYSARWLARALKAEGWTVSGTCRTADRQVELAGDGIDAFLFDRDHRLGVAEAALMSATHVLSSVPPDAEGDAVLDAYGDILAAAGGVHWVGYLSTTGVYGDTGGANVDETAPLAPTSARARRRVAAEATWRDLWPVHGVPVHVFRLAGIYGPGRSALDQVRTGTARRIDRPGRAFSRIHVDDISAVLRASISRPDPGAVYNVCDDEAAASADVVTLACELLGMAPPPLVPFEEAAAAMSPMALSFWRDNRRVDNRRVKNLLGVSLRHPSYRAGLGAILAEGG
jgi:nucleoside-diphosphate-sugar epimerase